MKKITAIILTLTLILSMCIIFTGCLAEDEVTDNVSTHTLPPTESSITTTAEPEYAEVACDIALIQSTTNTTILYADDFETFALVGSNDNDSYITLKLSDTATDIIKSTPDLSSLQLVVYGDTCGDVEIDPTTFTGEIAFGYDYSYEALCNLASTIRGLY